MAVMETDFPILGPSFQIRISIKYDAVKQSRGTTLSRLETLSDEEVAKHFDAKGNPISQYGRLFALETRDNFAKINETIWDEIALTPNRFRADFVVWRARTELTAEEIVLLSVGLEPTAPLMMAINGSKLTNGDGGTAEAELLYKRFVAVAQWGSADYPGRKIPITALGAWWRCCANEVTTGVPPSPDTLIPWLR